MAIESAEAALKRWEMLELVQDHYSEFLPFLEDVMEMLGFSVSEIQADIAKYIAYGPQSLMVAAQRGQAKTTIAAAYAVWDLIHHPRHRVLIVSAGASQANDISTLIVRIIMSMDVLACMRPDTQNGDRTSVEHFDVHYSLKGVDKSPSVKCLGITSNMQGNRADLLIPDDVESTKNASTAVQRAQLLHLTRDFASICSTGRIIYLGTFQSADSVYNSLPDRGIPIRIWPGRYPTKEQEPHYGEMLAPLLSKRMEADPSLQIGGGIAGDQGKPIEKEGTGWLDELNLQQKELDQGVAWFQLQHMLNTKLTDEQRHPLKVKKIILLDFQDKAPMKVTKSMDTRAVVQENAYGFKFNLALPGELTPETIPFQGTIAYVDPAAGGANGDETAYAVVSFANSTLYWRDIGGLPGGYTEDKMVDLANRLSVSKPSIVIIEKNLGYGAFQQIFTPIMRRVHKCSVEEDYVTVQKEKRIISTLEPVIGRHSLVVSPLTVANDRQDCMKYAPKDRQIYSVFFQMAKITHEKHALIHDDRLDALEGAVRYWQPFLALDEDKALQRAQQSAYSEMVSDPLGHNRYSSTGPRSSFGSMMDRYKR